MPAQRVAGFVTSAWTESEMAWRFVPGGSEPPKPLAVGVVGGFCLSTFLTLLMRPALHSRPRGPGGGFFRKLEVRCRVYALAQEVGGRPVAHLVVQSLVELVLEFDTPGSLSFDPLRHVCYGNFWK